MQREVNRPVFAGVVAMKPTEVIKGAGPLIFGQPHGGTYVPQDIFELWL